MVNRSTELSKLFKRISESVPEKKSGITDAQIAKPYQMITKVIIRPNPFSTTLTLDIGSEENKNIIVRMFDEKGKIIKMFSWYLVKGTNVTSINDLGNLNAGSYVLDIIDNEGTVLFSYTLEK